MVGVQTAKNTHKKRTADRRPEHITCAENATRKTKWRIEPLRFHRKHLEARQVIATCRPRLETARQATHRAEPQRPTDPSRGDRRMPRCRHLRPWNRCLAQARAEAQRRQAICPHASIHTKPKPTAEAQTSTGAGTLSMGSAALLGDLSSASDRDRRCGCLCVAPTIPGSTPSLILHAMLPEPPWLGKSGAGAIYSTHWGAFSVQRAIQFTTPA